MVTFIVFSSCRIYHIKPSTEYSYVSYVFMSFQNNQLSHSICHRTYFSDLYLDLGSGPKYYNFLRSKPKFSCAKHLGNRRSKEQDVESYQLFLQPISFLILCFNNHFLLMFTLLKIKK